MIVLGKRRSGFTLVEVIGTLFVITIFFGLIVGITQFSVSFFRNEDSQVARQASLRLIATQFEKDVRQHVATGVEYSQPDLNISVYHIRVDASTTIVYLFENNNVYRDGVLIGENVDDFDPKWNATKKTFDLTIISINDGYNRENKLEVRIVIRTGK